MKEKQIQENPLTVRLPKGYKKEVLEEAAKIAGITTNFFIASVSYKKALSVIKNFKK